MLRIRHTFKTVKILAGITCFLLLLLYFNHSVREKSVSPILLTQAEEIVKNTSLPPPVRLTIPALNIQTNIEQVSVNPKGEMAVPSTIVDVGWYDLGPRPGEMGSAVIAGHLNGEKGETGVFRDLAKLKAGDKLYVEYNQGSPLVFVVRESRTYNPGYADEVFQQSDGVHLNLITCSGVWDGDEKSYSKRLVVFADISP